MGSDIRIASIEGLGSYYGIMRFCGFAASIRMHGELKFRSLVS
jgi:hypothetical protein